MRYFIRLAYNGKPYHGWQRQENAPSVQALLEETLSLLIREKVELTGCGRTDTGVHARNYYAHFDTNQCFDKTACEQFIFKWNSFLPADVVIYDLFPVDENIHARFSAVSRTYHYYIDHQKNPFNQDFAYAYYHRLDIEKMNDAALLLFEYEDFSCFSKAHTQVKTNLCKIEKACWTETGSQYIFEVKANRFLRNMVRAIVGTLLEVGRGKMDKEGFRNVILHKNRALAGVSVPAKGLFLTNVVYP